MRKKQNISNKKTTVYLEIYPFDLHIIIGGELKSIQKYLNIYDIEFTDEDLKMWYFAREYRDPFCCLIYMETFIHSKFAHEAQHVVKYIMDFIGAKYNNGSEESYTYLLEYIIKKSYKQLKIKNEF